MLHCFVKVLITMQKKTLNYFPKVVDNANIPYFGQNNSACIQYSTVKMSSNVATTRSPEDELKINEVSRYNCVKFNGSKKVFIFSNLCNTVKELDLVNTHDMHVLHLLRLCTHLSFPLMSFHMDLMSSLDISHKFQAELFVSAKA